jgi:hypothetical protein
MNYVQASLLIRNICSAKNGGPETHAQEQHVADSSSDIRFPGHPKIHALYLGSFRSVTAAGFNLAAARRIRRGISA